MRAPQPEPPIPGSFATPSLLAWIVNGKYVMSLPLYRIETDLKACGATISRQDMANWMMNVHARWLAKVHERMKVELLSHVRIHADETTVQVLKEPNREAKKKSRMCGCSARRAATCPCMYSNTTRPAGRALPRSFLRAGPARLPPTATNPTSISATPTSPTRRASSTCAATSPKS